MKAFVIHLNNRTDRHQSIEDLKSKYSEYFDVEIMQAVDGTNNLQNHKFGILPNWTDPIHDKSINVGEIGCALSHFSCWQRIVQNNINMALILEDDVQFTGDVDGTLREVIAFTKSHGEFDGIYLGRNPITPVNNETVIDSLFVKANASYNAHAYMLSLQGAKLLIESSFLNNIIPVDDFLSVMYDLNYMPRIRHFYTPSRPFLMYALKTSIAIQNTFVSSITVSNVFKPSILYESQLDIDVSADKKAESAELITNWFQFMDSIKVNFCLQVKPEYSFVEKIISDIVNFHCNRLGIDVNRCCASFWTKPSPYNFDYIHMHVDHCDYEISTQNTMQRKPLFTTLTYFDDSDCPTVITKVTRNMKSTKTFQSNDNNELVLILPRILKHLCFDAGDVFHGEGYLQDYNVNTPRKTLVVAVWEMNNKPLHIPMYHNDVFLYHTFMKNRNPICEDTYKSDYPIVKFSSSNGPSNGRVEINITDNKVINETFFNDLIVRRSKTVLYPINQLLQRSDDKHSFVVRFPNIVLRQIQDPVNKSLERWKVCLRINETQKHQLFRHAKELLREQCVMNQNALQTNCDALETLILTVSELFLNKMSLNTERIYKTVSFGPKAIEHQSDSMGPFMTIFLHLSDAKTPTVLSNITKDEYKYKEMNHKNGICLFLPESWVTYCFDTSTYCYSHDKSLVIGLWHVRPEGFPLYQTQSANGKLARDDIGFSSLTQTSKTIKDPSMLESLLYQGFTPINCYDKSVPNELVRITYEPTNDIKSCDNVLKSLRFDPRQFNK